MEDKRALYAVVLVAVILMLLMGRKKAATQVVEQQPGATINVESPSIRYDLPPLAVRPPPAWDWMQTTDLSCGCDAGLWKEPVVINVVDTVVKNYPVYKNIIVKEYLPSPAPSYAFTTFIAPPLPPPPPLPTWWYEWGWNVHDEPAQYIVTSDGWTLIGGKYSRRNDIYGTYNNQDKYNWTKSDENVYYKGKRFVHDMDHDFAQPGSGGHQKQASFG